MTSDFWGLKFKDLAYEVLNVKYTTFCKKGFTHYYLMSNIVMISDFNTLASLNSKARFYHGNSAVAR